MAGVETAGQSAMHDKMVSPESHLLSPHRDTVSSLGGVSCGSGGDSNGGSGSGGGEDDEASEGCAMAGLSAAAALKGTPILA